MRNTARMSVGMDERTYTIRPAQCSTFHVLLTTGSRRALNASWRRWKGMDEGGGENDPRAEVLAHEEEDAQDSY